MFRPVKMKYPRRWAMIFWISAVLIVWLVTYAVRQGELLLVQRRASAEVASWLVANSNPEDRIMSESAMMTAGRPYLPLPPATSLAHARLWLPALQQAQPEWVIGNGSVGWQLVARSEWFARRYQVAYTRPPYTVWQRTAALLPPLSPLTVDVGGQTILVGVSFVPTNLQQGEDLAVTLAFSATQPLSQTFTTQLQLRSVADGTAVATTNRATPSEIPLGWWTAPLVIQESYLLDISGNVQTGSYELVLTIRDYSGQAVWPLTPAEPSTPMAEFVLGYVAVP